MNEHEDVGARMRTGSPSHSLTASDAVAFDASRRITQYLKAVLDVSLAAADHKATCEHDCNVSLGGLRRAAQLLSALVDDRERDEAERIVNAMPRF